MPAFRCNSCQGTYRDTQADGTLYFHACPPTPNPLFQPDTAKPLPDPRESIERPNKRDENITVDAQGKAAGIKAAGAGRIQTGP